jgi:hypothetical protein
MGACLVAQETAGDGAEQVVLPVAAGHTYDLVVDGAAAAGADYTLSVTCAKQ